jgi:hypothetical protein
MPNDHITRYDLMPIPPLEAHTTWFDAGNLRIGVEYRLLSDAIASASTVEGASGGDSAGRVRDDRGVSLHVCGVGPDGAPVEYLRFDCFEEDPHYHYVSWRDKTNEMLHIDPVADGDPLDWALERIRTRLAAMLQRAGAEDLARRIDAAELEAIWPRVSATAWKARFEHDDQVIEAAALSARPGAGTP